MYKSIFSYLAISFLMMGPVHSAMEQPGDLRIPAQTLPKNAPKKSAEIVKKQEPAKIYRWIDAKGKVQITDKMPPKGAKAIKSYRNTSEGSRSYPSANQTVKKALYPKKAAKRKAAPRHRPSLYTYADKKGTTVVNAFPPSDQENKHLKLKHAGVGHAKLALVKRKK